ncbi:succinylglutamate desuccinylase/aspartoacylase family protein [Candidatus Kaiserbacteria bacterium]|nr:succinylglutamate desuccinylase/aspartoacylase family protein [Candidatus Kaiserbacteria bacterium]
MSTSEEMPAPVAEEEVVLETVSPQSVIGTSVEGRSIEAYTYGEGSTHLLFVGGIHGGYEWNSVLLAYELIDYLEAYPEVLPETLTVTVIPALNPDGLYAVTKKEGQFVASDVTGDTTVGRFNANAVDLNRNFDCKWQPESTWRSQPVSAGTKAFSEPEAQALRDFVLEQSPTAVVFWHSKANAVYASECLEGVLPETLTLMNTYATAAKYRAVPSFDAYPVTGDAEGWLASLGIPAITVELRTHETIEWEQNRAAIRALFSLYGE